MPIGTLYTPRLVYVYVIRLHLVVSFEGEVTSTHR